MALHTRKRDGWISESAEGILCYTLTYGGGWELCMWYNPSVSAPVEHYGILPLMTRIKTRLELISFRLASPAPSLEIPTLSH